MKTQLCSYGGSSDFSNVCDGKTSIEAPDKNLESAKMLERGLNGHTVLLRGTSPPAVSRGEIRNPVPRTSSQCFDVCHSKLENAASDKHFERVKVLTRDTQFESFSSSLEILRGTLVVMQTA